MSNLFKVDNTVGAALIGFICSAWLFGVMSYEVMVYLTRFPPSGDGWRCKAGVVVFWLLELAHEICVGHFVYTYAITYYGQPLVMVTGDVAPTLMIQVIFSALASTVVKIYFARRIWRLSDGSFILTGIVGVLTLAQFALGLVYSAEGFRLKRLVHLNDVKLIATISLASGVLADTVTALALVYYLRSLRTGFRKADSVIDKLIIYAVNTGGLTSVLSICTLYQLRPTSFEFMGVYFVMSKLYGVSLLFTLNTRIPTVHTRGGTGVERDREMGLSAGRDRHASKTGSAASNILSRKGSSSLPQGVTVYVSTTVEGPNFMEETMDAIELKNIGMDSEMKHHGHGSQI
ncbi:hypothetical protein PM082_019396 [Marasmius tenuissimus]|nr:hypothetical protein PM082_019396 [Marasmius tenuissimus]